MTNLINTTQIYTSPTMYWAIQYEYQRKGSDMWYRFHWSVWLRSGSWYNNGLRLQVVIDGSKFLVHVKSYDPTNASWSYEGTTEWYVVQGKTSGSTSFYVSLNDISSSKTLVTSSTYNLIVVSAPSLLGTIPEFDVEGEVSIPITKYDSALTDSLVVSYGGTNIKTVSGIVNGATIKFTSAELTTIFGLMSAVKSGAFTFTLTTMNGSVLCGTSTATATGTITNANPTFDGSQIEYTDTNATVYGITGNPQLIVQNKSHLSVTIGTATGNKGATIASYSVSVNGVTKTATGGGTVEFGAVNTSRDAPITVVVTDSRGNTTTATKTITILSYATPTFAVVLERLNHYEDTTYLTVKAVISSLSGKNKPVITYKKMQSGGSFGSEVSLANNTKHTTTCDKQYSYIFSITVTDLFETVTAEYVLAKGKFPLFIDTAKNAVGVNEFPAEGEALRVSGGVACFDDGIVLKSANKSFKITINDSGALVIAEIT